MEEARIAHRGLRRWHSCPTCLLVSCVCVTRFDISLATRAISARRAESTRKTRKDHATMELIRSRGGPMCIPYTYISRMPRNKRGFFYLVQINGYPLWLECFEVSCVEMHVDSRARVVNSPISRVHFAKHGGGVERGVGGPQRGVGVLCVCTVQASPRGEAGR